MKTFRYIITIAAGLIFLGILATPAAVARHRSSVHIGIGVGYPYSYGYHHYPYRHHYYGDYYFGYSYGWPYYSPGVVVDAPIFVERPPVVIAEPAGPVRVYSAPSAVVYSPTPDTFADARNKKAELLNRLQSADKAEKINAISGLAGFSYDNQVNAKLTEILLNDQDPALRVEVIQAFAKVKNQNALSVLEKVRVSDDNKDVRIAADQAINQIKN